MLNDATGAGWPTSSPEPFRPLVDLDGYLPIEDHGLIGDGATAGLVGRDGAVSWLCAPRFDDPPLFASLLDARRGGRFRVAPESVVESRQWYEEDTAILVTELRGPDGTVRVRDCLPVARGARLEEPRPASRSELVRLVDAPAGNVRVVVELEPFGGSASFERRDGSLRVRAPGRTDLDLRLRASVEVTGPRTTFSLRGGRSAWFVLGWDEGGDRRDPVEAVGSTARVATMARVVLVRGTQRRARPAVGCHAQAARSLPHRGDRRRSDVVAARGDRWRAELGLPLRLGARRGVHRVRVPARGAREGGCRIRRVGDRCRRARRNGSSHVHDRRPGAPGRAFRHRPRGLPSLRAGPLGERRRAPMAARRVRRDPGLRTAVGAGGPPAGPRVVDDGPSRRRGGGSMA